MLLVSTTEWLHQTKTAWGSACSLRDRTDRHPTWDHNRPRKDYGSSVLQTPRYHLILELVMVVVVTVGGAARSWALVAAVVYVVAGAYSAVVQVGTVDIHQRLLIRQLLLRAYRLADRIPVLNTSINPGTHRVPCLKWTLQWVLA